MLYRDPWDESLHLTAFVNINSTTCTPTDSQYALQDPADRRHVLSDAALKQLTGQDRFQAFGFAKLFNKHLYPDG